MWSMLGIAFAAIAISAMELPPMLKQRKRKELLMFFALLLLGTILCTLLHLQYQLPNPTELIIYVHKPISDSLEAIFR